ncbi:hypothetical protein [Nguyenibacter sp. L1]|uniref:hypothetical protein n=1 Tax=Nguyenibacter sp. L1 TaxID=3049350 RepID=UPI002B469DAA|nr:hypothetical protein [Nguyenibacter sp. L1]WRH89140.1 hypothetical protein QN315_05805 [Nguyenibacter sp. L1]
MPAGCKRDAGATEGDVTANEDLMREHGVSQRILTVYREAAPCIETNAANVDMAALLRHFGEHYHEQLLEEQYPLAIPIRTGSRIWL